MIISDLRFKNEAKAIRDKDGILIKINRPNIEMGTDPAEVDLDDWDDWNSVIKNNGSLGDLNKKNGSIGGEIVSREITKQPHLLEDL